MQRRLKERLIGAAVLVMLAVIFIPMVLDDTSHTESTITETNIPAKPDTEFNSRIVPLSDSGEPETSAPNTGEIKTTETPAPETGDITTAEASREEADTGAVAETETNGEEEAAAASEVKSGEKPSSGKGDIGLTAWVVQLGSFSSENNANSLNDKLRKAGFSSFVEPIKQGSKVIYRVRVGPELRRSDAQALRDHLRRNMKLDGMILSYP